MDGDAQTRLAMAALMAALARTLGEKDRTFADRFRRHLADVSDDLQGAPGDTSAVRDLLRTTQTLLGEDEIEADEPAWLVYAKEPDPDLSETTAATEHVPVPTLSAALTLWDQLPAYDRDRAVVETASGRQLKAAEIRRTLARWKARKETA